MGIFSNIIVGLIIVALTVTIQGYGTKIWVKFLLKKYHHLATYSFDHKSVVWLLIFTVLFLLFLNFLEATIWAFTYYYLPGVTEFETFEKAIYFSLVTFTTLGYGDITISSTNRILSGFEAMNGILLLGWSTSMMFSIMLQIMRNSFKQEEKIEKNEKPS